VALRATESPPRQRPHTCGISYRIRANCRRLPQDDSQVGHSVPANGAPINLEGANDTHKADIVADEQHTAYVLGCDTKSRVEL
jgi:hypothetical protein